MNDLGRPERAEAIAAPTYRRVVGEVGLVLLVLVGLAVARSMARSGPRSPVASPPAPIPTMVDETAKRPAAHPALEPPEVSLPVDTTAVARAEGRASAAQRERERAQADLARTEAELKAATAAATAAALERKALPETLRDPTARLDQAARRSTSLEAELAKLRTQSAGLAAAPRPRGKPLVDQAPVARTPEGDEFHFEVRRDRVTFIDLEKLMEKMASDARVRMRIAGPGARRVGGTVGPAGAFSLRYELMRQVDMIDEVLDLRGTTFGLSGWELVPEAAARGETRDVAAMPTSEYTRAIRRLRPGKSTITFWVYPDGFDLYRQLRDQLHERGFLVAGRPLPANVPIRGSPGGTASASQ